MHMYSINSRERTNIQLALAVISILLAWFLNNNYNFPWWFEAPSIFGFYGILYTVFNEYIWQSNTLSRLGIVRTPNIIGVWKGHLKTSFNSFQSEHDIKVQIYQNWTAIGIEFDSATSKGKSITAVIEVDEKKECILTYTYFNEPNASAPKQMNIHRGTSTICFSNDLKTAQGDYYSGRGRQQFGEITLKRAFNK